MSGSRAGGVGGGDATTTAALASKLRVDASVAGEDATAALASELRVVLGQLLRRLRSQHRFSLSQAIVLGRLDREGTASIGDLALAERVRPQSMAQTVSDLEALGLVARREDPTDGRRALIELTEHGLRELAEDRRRREGWLADAISEQFTARERQLLGSAVALLRRLAEG
jgi:DNA-binding MarR family transcriptional regulator